MIIDTIDDMNPNSANAILKILEEPPRKVIFMLINNSEGGFTYDQIEMSITEIYGSFKR